MDFDTAKENIQPLRQGRRADRLETALQTEKEMTDALMTERRQYEEAIKSYEGSDPLSIWYDYICWIQQSYLKSGAESPLDQVVLKCIVNFEDDPRYRQDRRMIKLYIKYIDTQENPHEMYNQLYSSGIGTMVSDLYIAWAYYYDAIDNFKQVEYVFKKGIDAGAQPFDELTQAHSAFAVSMSKRLLYDDESSKRQFQATMEEKRSALTALRAHKHKFVGSLRTGIAVKSENPGVVNQENISSGGKLQLAVHEDDKEVISALPPNTSVIRSIIDSAVKRENAHEPGPWTKAKLGKGKLFGKSLVAEPGFDIMEDECLTPIPVLVKNFDKGIELACTWIARNNTQKPWNIPITVEEPIPANSLPCYEKILLYPKTGMEISPEELLGYLWFKKQGVKAPLTEQYDPVWLNNIETGIRLPPGFASKNIPQIDEPIIQEVIPDEDTSGFMVSLKQLYPKAGEILSCEELLIHKWQQGHIKLAKEEDFEEIEADDDMEMTMIGDRRQSIYPTARKSVAPRKSIVMKKSIAPHLPRVSNVQEEDEQMEPQQQCARFQAQHDESLSIPLPASTGAIRKSIIKRKIEDDDDAKGDDEKGSDIKNKFVSETPPRSSFESFVAGKFKTPAPVEKKVIRLEDDDVSPYSANETCCTQQFNFFIKSQSVSTPISKKNVPKLLPLPIQQFESLSVEDLKASPEHSTEILQNLISSNVPLPQQPSQTLMTKQLSVIMETTENTHSTKSSCASHIEVENETDLYQKTTPTFSMMKSLHESVSPEERKTVQQNPMLSSFRMPEEQTETCPNMMLRPIQAIADASMTVPKMMISLKELDVPEMKAAFEIFEDGTDATETIRDRGDSSLKIPTADVENSMKIPSPEKKIEHSMKLPELDDRGDSMELPEVEIPEIQKLSLIEIPATEPADDPQRSSLNFSSPIQFEIDNKTLKESFIEIPATQDFNEITATQEPAEDTLKNSLHYENAVPSEKDNKTLKESFIEIPATQDYFNDISAADNTLQESMCEIPATQAPMSDDILKDSLVIPSSQAADPVFKVLVAAKQEAEEISKKATFNIFEDSVLTVPSAKIFNENVSPKISKPVEDTDFLHISRKENLLLPPPKSLKKRTTSDEFFEMFGKTPEKTGAVKKTFGTSPIVATSPTSNDNISDFLKFSDVGNSPRGSLENSFKEVTLRQSTAKVPTPTLFEDENINTAAFTLALNENKNNSTLLPEPFSKSATKALSVVNELDLSISFNENEWQALTSQHIVPPAPPAEQKLKRDISPPKIEFKVPIIPAPKLVKPKPMAFEVYEEAIDDGDTNENDLSKSIYYQKPPQPELDNGDEWHEEERFNDCSFVADAYNRYEHTIVTSEDHNVTQKIRDAIVESDGNPFDSNLRELMLEQCNFSQYLEEHVATCTMLKKIPQVRPGSTVTCADHEFTVLKFIAKGAFGSVFTGRCVDNNETYALKQEKPASLWEYYICAELQDRLKNPEMLNGFMRIEFAVVANNASILISQFSSYGSIIQVCNKYKAATNRNVDEYVGMALTVQLLSIIDHLHSCKIIHGDIKPDNFLLMTKIGYGMRVPAIQLIDFGSAIDMDWYQKDDTFKTVVETDNFKCIEMMEKQPWTYQTDLFGLAGTSHVMLFGKYMEVEKKLFNWNIKSKFPRYFNKHVWEVYFSTLLNITDCQSMPNLQALKNLFDEQLDIKKKYVCDKIAEFNKIMG